jgi:V8-like Glu-specific endopeptidase
MGRHRHPRRKVPRVLVASLLSVLGLMGFVALIVVVGVPALGRGDAAQQATVRSPSKIPVAWAMIPSTPLTAATFAGTPAVGALFSADGGRLAQHFCTASVVDSPTGNLLITAAHCVSGSVHTGQHLAFVPSLHDDVQPYGVWSVTKVTVDAMWSSSADPDHDVAFLTVQRDGTAARIQDFTGANKLGMGKPSGVVRVIGYPNDQGAPIRCQNRAGTFSARQQEFDCKDYGDGTSGGPFVTDTTSSNGNGTVVGVIGGHDTGGLTPDVSYSIIFGKETKALYNTAISQS